MSAIQQVLNTYELLENILLHVPLYTLLFSKRVSKSFADVIDRSEHIRRALFLDAMTEDTVEFARDPNAPQGHWHGWQWSNGKFVQSGLAPLMNPFLFLRGDRLGWLSNEEDRSRALPPMLISHPPMRTIVSIRLGHTSREPVVHSASNGVRLPQVQGVIRNLRDAGVGAEALYGDPNYMFGSSPCTTSAKGVREVTAREMLDLLEEDVLKDRLGAAMWVSELAKEDVAAAVGAARRKIWPCGKEMD